MHVWILKPGNDAAPRLGSSSLKAVRFHWVWTPWKPFLLTHQASVKAPFVAKGLPCCCLSASPPGLPAHSYRVAFTVDVAKMSGVYHALLSAFRYDMHFDLPVLSGLMLISLQLVAKCRCHIVYRGVKHALKPSIQ